jgi:hypothetical protein
MRYNVYVDLSRCLTNQERSAVFEALETNVPDSGCVGPHKGEQQEEVFFRVEAPSDEEAGALAARYAAIVLKHSGLDTQYSVSLQTGDGGFRAWTV